MSTQPEIPGLALPERERHRGPVAVVRLDLPAAHLDQEFDYALPEKLLADAAPGVRITARFGPSDRPGFITRITDGSDHEGELRNLRSVVSDLPVLTTEVAAAVGEVAKHYAGTYYDVLRLAIPARHARTENQVRERATQRGIPSPPRPPNPAALHAYPGGDQLISKLASGASPTVAWQALPGVVGSTPQWLVDALELVLATLTSGRRVLIIVPAARDITRVLAVLAEAGVTAIGYGSSQKPAARYRAFLLALLGQVDVVVGTRSAAWAPLPDLGLTIVFDEADPLLRERHAPRPQVWRIALARAGATVFASLGRSVQTQLLVQRGQAESLTPSRDALRSHGARVVMGDASDGPARRLSSVAFSVAREALQRGPVLVLVPRAGYVNMVRCARCGEEVRCPECASPVTMQRGNRLRCTWAGHITHQFSCPECSATHVRAAAIGSERTADELGRAFPGVLIRVSGARTGIIENVDSRPAIVVATPGAEPVAPDGYEAGIVIDASVLTARTELSGTAHATTQLANAWSLIKPGPQGGRFVLTGEPDEAVAQALTRSDFPNFADRLLAERAELHLPPVATVADLTGPRGTLADIPATFSDTAPGVEILGPTALNETTDRVLIRVPHAGARALRARVAALIRKRSTRSEPPVSATMDPLDL